MLDEKKYDVPNIKKTIEQGDHPHIDTELDGLAERIAERIDGHRLAHENTIDMTSHDYETKDIVLEHEHELSSLHREIHENTDDSDQRPEILTQNIDHTNDDHITGTHSHAFELTTQPADIQIPTTEILRQNRLSAAQNTHDLIIKATQNPQNKTQKRLGSLLSTA